MAANVGKNTKPELLVRRAAHALGYRYRLHRKDLPGKPDLIFSGRKKIIEVRGCFWHRHAECRGAASPATRHEFWQEKFDATVSRDAHNLKALEDRGWTVMVIWECEAVRPDLGARLQTFLGAAPRSSGTRSRDGHKPFPTNP